MVQNSWKSRDFLLFVKIRQEKKEFTGGSITRFHHDNSIKLNPINYKLSARQRKCLLTEVYCWPSASCLEHLISELEECPVRVTEWPLGMKTCRYISSAACLPGQIHIFVVRWLIWDFGTLSPTCVSNWQKHFMFDGKHRGDYPGPKWGVGGIGPIIKCAFYHTFLFFLFVIDI